MGFKEIWNLLRSEGLLTELAGVGDHLQVLIAHVISAYVG